jgi:mono/diheme cytochrome c family protein
MDGIAVRLGRASTTEETSKMRRITLGSPILLVAAIISLFAFVVVASTAKAADLAAAKKTYEEKCAKCHGLTGKGDGPKAKSLKKKPRDYTDKGKMAELTDEKLIKETLDGKKPMPSYRGKLTEAQIADLIVYIRTFAK